MKRWYIYMFVCVCVFVCVCLCVCVCMCVCVWWVYFIICCLLTNIKQRSFQQSTISAHELPSWSLRILSNLRGKFYCTSLTTVAVDINVETWKENGILFSQFAQNVEEARFLKNVKGWDYLLGNRFKIKFPKIWLYIYMAVFP